MSDNTATQVQRSNTTLWIMLASFLVPAILAYGYFFFGDRPSVRSNGELISPVIDIEELSMRDADGVILSREQLTPKWRLYYFVPSSCDENCKASLFNVRQINKALGKNQSRVEHVIVHLESPADDFSKHISTEHENAVRTYVTAESLPSKPEQNINFQQGQYIYLMDPLGNIMMRFPEALNPKLILKDINKLLKVSRIG